jgi:hypothetical protein
MILKVCLSTLMILGGGVAVTLLAVVGVTALVVGALFVELFSGRDGGAS